MQMFIFYTELACLKHPLVSKWSSDSVSRMVAEVKTGLHVIKSLLHEYVKLLFHKAETCFNNNKKLTSCAN